MGEIMLLSGERTRVVARMPICEHHDRLLRPGIAYYPTKNGDSVEALDLTIKVAPGSLLPESDCHDILDEVDRVIAPATPPMAKHLASVLISFYPVSTDRQSLVTALASAFEAFPPDVGFLAIDAITEILDRTPTQAEVRRQCHVLMKERLYRRRVAELHLREHEAIALEHRTHRKRKREWARRCTQLPHLRIYRTWERRFRQNIVLWRWLFALPGWIQEYGAAEVEAWHERIGDQAQLPIAVYAELLKFRDAAKRS